MIDSKKCSPTARKSFISFFVALLLVIILPRLSFPEEYEFDISEFEKKPYSIGGYLELKSVMFGLQEDSAFYKLRFFDKDEGDTTYEFTLRAQFDLSYQKGAVDVFVQPDFLYTYSYRDEELTTEIFQSYISVKPSTPLGIYAGKRVVRWGKGYAWNPVGFIERPKDPNDPDIAREGFVMLAADYTKSFEGALKTISVTSALIPVYEEVNEDFGQINEVNFAGKVYFLLFDTDIDLMFLAGESKPARFGADFSRNITSNFEVHGEAALIDDFKKKQIDATGQVTESVYDAKSYLLGLRYLSAADTTYILEYYHNGSGFRPWQMREYYSLIDSGYQDFLSTGNPTFLNQAKSLSNDYGGQNPMRHYLYLRISQKDPFGTIYLTPALIWIQNLSDDSFSVLPEITYKGFTNLEIKLKCGILSGKRDTEYGEKQNDYRAELRIRYFF